MDEKAIVKIGADGSPMKCAKGLTTGCGYKAGAKICGKCGAMAVQIKDDDEWTETPEAFEGDYATTFSDPASHRLASMGFKSAEIVGADVFVCAFERKVLPGSAEVCSSCPGGCAAEENMPSLLEVEGFAEQLFDGKVLDSGYSDEADLFVVDVECKTGEIVEAYFDGPTGEHRGWITLDSDLIDRKDALSTPFEVISFSEAADLAIKSVDGDPVSIEADLFDGADAYVVGVDGYDGKAYDVWISLDGKVLAAENLGYLDEDDDVAVKRMYTDEQRSEMADAGTALPDGSYPIADEDDLRNAIQAFGRAKDPAKAKAHIMKRARALGMEDMIPENWMSGGEKGMDEAEDYVGMNDDEDPMGGKSLLDAIEDPELLAAMMEFQTLELEEELKDIL